MRENENEGGSMQDGVGGSFNMSGGTYRTRPCKGDQDACSHQVRLFSNFHRCFPVSPRHPKQAFFGLFGDGI